ncbi:MAG: hypothetical protein QOF11_2386 [Chloroflexota bacterium]|jgi:predicted short-subunit dehydrogenase-like oxidoreductase (DUF2520 family)|nr:hypothetical protein [Chloroflexota bacterium]
MRTWRQRGRDGDGDRDKLGALRDAGIDLDPDSSRGHDHGDDSAHDHAHPHQHSGPGEPPLIGIVGAGAVGSALGLALTLAGWPIRAVASRDPARRERFKELVGGTRAFAEITPLLDEVELIILAVPDDAIESVARSIRLYSGQALIHTSGALGAEVLEPAMAAGTQVGSFHPLVAFADTSRAVEALHGATIAVEGDDQLVTLLAEMAAAIGARAVRLAPGTKAAYHAAAVLAAGGFVALLDAIAELGRVAGLDEAGSLAIYGPLIEQTLGNSRVLGIKTALTGPLTRGDVGTLEAHLAALAAHAPDVLPLYRAAAIREIALAEERGALTPDVSGRLRTALANTP